MKQGSNANADQEDLVAWLSSSGERRTLHLSKGHSTRKSDSRIQRAVTRLIDCDAGIRLALEHRRSGSLSWTFDPRPGHEHDHDRAIEMGFTASTSTTRSLTIYISSSGPVWRGS